MSSKSMNEIREKLCRELDLIAKKGDLSAGDLETLHKLTDTIKNIDKIEMLDDGGYSQAGVWEAEMRGDYGRGNSYANRGQHYVRGHYSRDDGYSMNGYSRDGYSRDNYSRDGYSQQDGRGGMMDRLNRMLDDAPSDKERETIRRCINIIERA